MSSTANMIRPMPSVFAGAFLGPALTAFGVLELRQLEPAVAVRGLHHGDVASDTVEPDGPVHPWSFDGRLALRARGRARRRTRSPPGGRRPRWRRCPSAEPSSPSVWCAVGAGRPRRWPRDYAGCRRASGSSLDSVGGRRSGDSSHGRLDGTRRLGQFEPTQSDDILAVGRDLARRLGRIWRMPRRSSSIAQLHASPNGSAVSSREHRWSTAVGCAGLAALELLVRQDGLVGFDERAEVRRPRRRGVPA